MPSKLDNTGALVVQNISNSHTNKYTQMQFQCSISAVLMINLFMIRELSFLYLTLAAKIIGQQNPRGMDLATVLSDSSSL